MKKIILTLFCFSVVTLLYSAPVTILAELSGTVYDSLSELPVEYASVAVFRSSDSTLVMGTVTGADGRFAIQGLKQGTYYIEIRFIGYKTRKINNIITSGSVNLGNIIIEPDVQLLSAAEITADKNVIQYQIDKQVINPSNMLSASNGSVIDVIRQSPSVTTDNEDNIMLRGSGDFLLLIDGKPVIMNRTDVMKQISASQVAKVEIITNPSAKYDAAGASGIIHIYTIKSDDRFSGMLNTRTGTGHKYNIDGIVRKSAGKFTFQMTGNYNLTHHPSSSINEWTSVNPGNDLVLTSDVQRYMIRNNAGITPEIEFRISPSTKISVNGSYTRFNFDRSMEVFYDNFENNINTYSVSEDRFYLGADMLQAGLYFRHDFDTTEHFLEISGNYLNWQGINDQGMKQFHSDVSGSSGNQFSDNTFYEDHLMNDMFMGVDYQRPLSLTMTIETGLRTSYRGFIADKEFKSKNMINDVWYYVPQYSGRHSFHEEMQSAYLSASKMMNKVSLKAGIRVQYFTRTTDIPEQNTNLSFRRLYWFPSVHLNYQGKKGRQWQASFSRRIQLPDDWSTSPVPIYSDGFIIQTGNPALEPELYDVAELNHIRYIKENMISMSLFCRITHNAAERLLQINNNNQFVVMPENVADKFYSGAEAGSNLTILPWLSATINASGYIMNSNVNRQDTSFSYSQFSWTARGSLQFKAGKSTRFELGGNYLGPEKESQGIREAMYGVDISARQTLLKNKLTMTLSWNNIFNTGNFKVKASYNDYQSTFTFKPEYPVVFLGISYRFNDFKPAQRRQNQPDVNTPAL